CSLVIALTNSLPRPGLVVFIPKKPWRVRCGRKRERFRANLEADQATGNSRFDPLESSRVTPPLERIDEIQLPGMMCVSAHGNSSPATARDSEQAKIDILP